MNEYKIKIDKWYKGDKLNYCLDFLLSKNILDFEDKAQFERYIDILLYINNKEYNTIMPYDEIIQVLNKQHLSDISKKYDYNEDSLKAMMSEKLKGNYPEYPFNIIRNLITGLIKRVLLVEIIFSKENMLQIAKDALDDLIENDKQITPLHLDLLYTCIVSINQTTQKFILDKDACSKIRALIEENPERYFENFVRLGGHSSNTDFNFVACEPFWEQIFGSAEKFEEFLNKQDSSTIPNIERTKNFWELYKNNRYKMISFSDQGNVQEKIDNDLKEEYKMLQKLLEIERKMKNSIDSKELKKLLARIYDEIQLPISKRDEIRRNIVSQLALLKNTEK
jgi:hypothetical protein